MRSTLQLAVFAKYFFQRSYLDRTVTVLLFFLFLLGVTLCNANPGLSDSDFPDQFYIWKNPQIFGTLSNNFKFPGFNITDKEKVIGYVRNTDRGEIDFYDSAKEIRLIGLYEYLFDLSGKCLGKAKPLMWRYTILNSKLVEVLSDINSPLAKLEKGEEHNSFVFLDEETQRPLVVIQFVYIQIPSCYLPLSFSEAHYALGWGITILDRSRLQERQIPIILLVWGLLYTQGDEVLGDQSL